MSGQSYQSPAALGNEPSLETTPAVQDSTAVDNSAALAQAGLGGVVSTVSDWATDIWDWLWGKESTPDQGPGQEPGQKLDPAQECRTRDGVPTIDAVTGVVPADVRNIYANNPRAQAAMDTLTNDPNFAKLSADQQGGLLQRFQQAPNAATTQYLQGLAAYHSSDDPCGAGLEAYNNALNADGGTFTANGTTYSIVNGQLMDTNGVSAGNIHTDGTYQLNGATERSNYYDDLHTRVQMTEGTGTSQKTLLNLHDSDPANALTDPNVNPTFSGMALNTLRDTRRENMDMRVDNSYRSIAEQDRIYNRHDGSTNARGGQSWHNYGVATDIVFNDANGRKSWPEGGDYRQLWTRYGELGEQNGLDWGGRWNNPDRPHLEYHPGFTPRNASTLTETVRTGGLEAGWDRMGIGAQP